MLGGSKVLGVLGVNGLGNVLDLLGGRLGFALLNSMHPPKQALL
jgi:hypothetical protein